MPRRFDAPTAFAPPPAAGGLVARICAIDPAFAPQPAAGPCACDGTTDRVEDGVENVVEKAQREARERAQDAWKSKK